MRRGISKLLPIRIPARIQFRISALFLALLLTMAAGGCALLGGRISRTDAEARVAEARRHLEMAGTMDLETLYPADHKAATETLSAAESALSGGRNARALEAADESVAASRRMLTDFYLNHIALLAEKLKEELNRKTADDPDNPLTAQIPEVESVITEARAAKSGGGQVSLDQVIADLERIMRITYSIRTTLNRTLESDVSFDTGRYRLSDKGLSAIDRLLTSVIADRDGYLSSFPGKTIVTRVKVVGYTDALNFGEGSRLLRELQEGLSSPPPAGPVERRRFFNSRLSELRADTIAEYIRTTLRRNAPEDRFEIDIQSVGKGEDIPPDVSPPYPVMDPRRRISRIYIYTTTQ